MSTELTYEILLQNEEDLQKLAAKLAPRFKGGEVCVFKSDVGGGKTTFVKHIVKAMGSKDHVSSPTFAISKQYRTPEFRIVHYDFYRLHNATYVSEVLREELSDEDTIAFIEWPETVGLVIEPSLTIELSKDTSNENYRHCRLTPETDFTYLTRDLHS